MFKELFINATIVISFVSIIYQIFRNTGLSRKSSFRHRLLSGVIWGLMGIPLIIFGFNVAHVTPKVIVDFRIIAIILSAFFGGFASVTVTGIIIGIYRILHSGITASSIGANLMLVGLVIGTGLISNLKTRAWIKWFGMLFWGIILSSLLYFVLIPDFKMSVKVIIGFWIGAFIVGFLVFHYIQFLSTYGKMTLKWKNEATKDFLTGLYNVREFDRVFNEMIRVSREESKPLSLLLIDVDFFKKVNDTYGHITGDYVLKDLGALLRGICRGTAKAFRKGGEEMTILVPNCSLHDAQAFAERVRLEIMARNFQTDSGDKFKITVSIGVATYPESVSNPEALIESADNALYKAKRNGRNQVQLL